MFEERYIRYALSRQRYVELDCLMGQLCLEGMGLDEGPLTASETWNLCKFMVENRNIIDECCREAEQI
jgi:hypothetical protein